MCINISFSNVPPSDSSFVFPLFPHYFLKWNKVGFHLRWRKPQEITPTITVRKSWIIYKILTCLGPTKNWAHKISKWTGIREGQVPLRRYGAWARLPVPKHRKSKLRKVDKKSMPAFIALVTADMGWKQLKCLLIDEWINKMWHICIIEHYVALKRKGNLIHAVTWMNLEDIMWVKETSHKKTNS